MAKIDDMTLNEASEALREAMRATIKRHSMFYLIQATLMVVGGILAVVYPLFSSVALVVVLGWILIFFGVVQLIGLIGANKVPHFWLQLISVVLSIVIGFLFVRNPAAGVGTLALLLVVFLMVEGMSKVVFSLTIRPLPNWGWVLFSGVIGVVLSAYLLTNPGLSMVLFGIFIGLQLISEGIAIGYMAWKVRSA